MSSPRLYWFENTRRCLAPSISEFHSGNEHRLVELTFKLAVVFAAVTSPANVERCVVSPVGSI